jgi:hypothetical protein
MPGGIRGRLRWGGVIASRVSWWFSFLASFLLGGFFGGNGSLCVWGGKGEGREGGLIFYSVLMLRRGGWRWGSFSPDFLREEKNGANEGNQ